MTFVLVHGAWHGGWCWERLVAVLADHGHAAVAPDLPCEDSSATWNDYADVVGTAIDNAPANDVVLVGHSLGGMTIPVVAARRSVRAMVFLGGVVPKFGGEPWDDGPTMDAPDAFEPLVTHPNGSTSWPFDAARATLYSDCTDDDAAWAFARLRQQNSASLWDRPYPLTEWPDCQRVSMAGTADRVVSLAWSHHVAATRLGVRPIEYIGGHAPFLAQPRELAQMLISAMS